FDIAGAQAGACAGEPLGDHPPEAVAKNVQRTAVLSVLPDGFADAIGVGIGRTDEGVCRFPVLLPKRVLDAPINTPQEHRILHGPDPYQACNPDQRIFLAQGLGVSLPYLRRDVVEGDVGVRCWWFRRAAN